ncbi:hypothetical protein Misp01_55100 [Microtetraspora sp. NBRC 13810]|uniref:hypothetical protein n=1 Tax=Microtetraspora sp. NBRC 13810 TaxID=3030990 RepID=UPI0024A170E0|nr:hypothetical protein [Microtetraspora sp. NBRC 13810]GLW10382.1 hypothetical protein Misp01_55100 [Microtetraspora sp. NBRC 13810]
MESGTTAVVAVFGVDVPVEAVAAACAAISRHDVPYPAFSRAQQLPTGRPHD